MGQLIDDAIVIKNETQRNSNTAQRVGGWMEAASERIESNLPEASAPNYISSGRTINYFVPGGESVQSGEMVVIGNIVGVAQSNGNPGDTVVLFLGGIFEFNTGGSIDAGDNVYYSTPDSVDLGLEGAFVGVAIAGSLAGKVQVLLK